MITLDFVEVHRLCSRVAEEGLIPENVFGEEIDGYRESVYGGFIRGVDYDAFLERCQTTSRCVALKKQYDSAWKIANGQY